MCDYILVRESRDGRQSSDETIHAIKDGESETICEELKSKQTRTVRTLSIFMNESNFCSECSNKIDNFN